MVVRGHLVKLAVLHGVKVQSLLIKVVIDALLDPFLELLFKNLV